MAASSRLPASESEGVGTKKKLSKKLPGGKRAIAKGVALPKRQFPAHLSSTPEEWRALKRTEWREIVQALQRFHHGSAYVPAKSPLWTIDRAAQQITDAIEAPDWIAW